MVGKKLAQRKIADSETESMPIHQESGTILAERAMKASHLRMDSHESHTNGDWCRMGPTRAPIRWNVANRAIRQLNTTPVVTLEGLTGSIRCSAILSRKSANISLRVREPDAVLKRATSGS